MRKPRVIRAKNYQAKDNPHRVIADLGVRPISHALFRAFKHLRGTLPKDAIAKHIHAGRYHAAAHEIPVQRFRDSLKGPFAEITKVYKASADRAAQKITRQIRHVRRVRKADTPGIGDQFTFDMLTPEVIDQLSNYQDGLLQGLSADVREIVLQTIIDGVQAGDTPEEIADQLSRLVGLTPQQTAAIDNFRSMLESGDREALTRSLMSAEDSAAYQDVLDQGLSLEPAQVDQMVQNYADAMTQARATTIARTEASRAANLGLNDAYQQAVDRGAVPASGLTRYWEIALDERTCRVCMDIPDMNPDGRAQDEPFDTSIGPIDYPPVHPNCRCTVGYDTELDQLDQSAGE